MHSAVAMEGKARQAYRTVRAADVTVAMGGPSTERDVSLVSGAAVADALERAGHRVTRVDLTPADVSALDRPGIDVVFLAMHGDWGESGEAQQLCEDRKLRYTGSGPQASRTAMNKVASKEVFQAAGLTTPRWAVIDRRQSRAEIGSALAPLGLPAVFKPIDGGSSVDIVIARSEQERDAGVERLLGKYGRFLAETFIKGRELTVGLLGDQALPMIEVIPAREFYDYTAKYADGSGTRYSFEHGLDASTTQRVQDQALRAFRSLGCRDMSRVDFLLDDSGTPYVLEINTIPGFTSHSLLPMAAARVGICFEELVDRLVGMAMSR